MTPDFLRVMLCALLALLCCQASPTERSVAGPELVPHQYIVRLTSGMTQDLFQSTLNLVREAMSEEDEIRYEFNFANFRGFSMQASPAVVAAVRAVPGIVTVEPNAWHTLQALQPNTKYNLDRVSHRTNSYLNGRAYDYVYEQPAGRDTVIYVIDSGVRVTHEDFGGRAYKGPNFAPANGAPNENKDYNGHGTHVASTAAGAQYGVAKNAKIFDVKILNYAGNTTIEAEMRGIDYSVKNAQKYNAESTTVLQMSFGGVADQSSTSLTEAVNEASNAGFFCSVAAGNNAINVLNFAPANAQFACTCGALDAADHMTDFSNYGNGIDIWAPGFHIYAAGNENDTAVKILSGTSMASPHVAGVAALLKSYGAPYIDMSPTDLCSFLAKNGSKNAITYQSFAKPPGPNVILYNGGTHL